MLALVAIVLAQSCVDDAAHLYCSGSVWSPRVLGGQFEAPNYSAVNLFSRRGSTDPGADLVLFVPDKAQGNDNNLVEVRVVGGGLVYRVGHNGQVIGNGIGEAAFLAEYGGEGYPSLACKKASGPLGGCNLFLRADMDPANQSAEHGWHTIGNLRPGADGGYPLQVIATGRSLGPTVALMDVYSNLALYGGMVRPYVPLADRQRCEPGAPRDGVIRGSGMLGYIADGVDALQVCTPASGNADGGYETVITDRSLAARLVTIEARLTALEAQ